MSLEAHRAKGIRYLFAEMKGLGESCVFRYQLGIVSAAEVEILTYLAVSTKGPFLALQHFYSD